MALADWEVVQTPDDLVNAVELRSDKVFEGSKALFLATEYAPLVHKQTMTDKPVSGAVKTYVLFPPNTGAMAIVFKVIDQNNMLFVYLAHYGGEVGIETLINGTSDNPYYANTGVSLESDVWYIVEAICDDENNTITIRVKDTDENILLEHAIPNAIPAELKGKGGGIGIDGTREGIYIDLTKIYYP